MAYAYSDSATGAKTVPHIRTGSFEEIARTAATIADRRLFDLTTQEVQDLDKSSRVQNITAAGAIDLDAQHVRITGPAASTYAVTLGVPLRPGIVKIIEMVATTATNAVTLALTNVVGGTAATSASFDAVAEILVVVSAGGKWCVIGQAGVTLT
jgi:hypothetical protein